MNTLNKPICMICGTHTEYHIYKSERGEAGEYRTCEECEEELRK